MEIIKTHEKEEFPGMKDRLTELSERPPIEETVGPWHGPHFYLGMGLTALIFVSIITAGNILPWINAWENPPALAWLMLAVNMALAAAYIYVLILTRR